ncbi:hypothetical protein THAOC_26087 [Thalassiosira oceanica]|uniref:Uncharacterized protein n=1 Tax=Thalassiosira oceanica TaxID=159749 RepID=K0RKQ1_THAOC|nr:hypothetical protein THAOC_26087 [Thalassiosira oceanica]|eukprot:EJK54303.1 hypothetical protein THAOC_26087 [Thalassiosira oceanica]
MHSALDGLTDAKKTKVLAVDTFDKAQQLNVVRGAKSSKDLDEEDDADKLATFELATAMLQPLPTIQSGGTIKAVCFMRLWIRRADMQSNPWRGSPYIGGGPKAP